METNKELQTLEGAKSFVKNLSDGCRKNLIEVIENKEILNDKKVFKEKKVILCPFPDHKHYTELWESLGPKCQKEMKENIRITADGKIEIIKMKKKFSILTAQHDGIDIFTWSHVDKNRRTGHNWLTYLTGRAAKQECKKQNKKLLNDRTEVEEFINYFPWDNTKERIYHFVRLFDLGGAGYWSPHNKRWHPCGSVEITELSRVIDFTMCIEWRRLLIDSADVNLCDPSFPSPFVVYEPTP